MLLQALYATFQAFQHAEQSHQYKGKKGVYNK